MAALAPAAVTDGDVAPAGDGAAEVVVLPNPNPPKGDGREVGGFERCGEVGGAGTDTIEAV